LLAWGGDQALRRLYQHWQPRLEQTLGRVLGHPLALGPYQGLAWDGLRLGPSRIGAGPTDASSVAVRSVAVSLDPLASLRLRLPVLHVTLAGVRADLRRNRQGQYWVPGRLALGFSPPIPSLPSLYPLIELASSSLSSSPLVTYATYHSTKNCFSRESSALKSLLSFRP
jgi:translocation and assembly module TamB